MTKHARVPAGDGAPEHQGPEVQRIPRFGQRYFAFLSYSHKDQVVADWLHDELEKFRVPHALQGRLTASGVIPRRLAPIFRDRHELAASNDLGAEIEEALGASHFLIVLCSPEAAKSRWTNAEIEVFKQMRPEGCIFAAIVDGEPFASDVPGREEDECFPPALRQKYDRRGRPTGKRAEPLAADLREEGDGRRTGFLKLVAGMLGVGLDELVQRETTRRHRRLALVTAASLIAALVALVLMITAIQARDAARDQRREAEGLVAFMLGDLREKLEPIGKLDALDGVGARVLAYYSKQDASELSDGALLQRSRALNLTAQVAYSRGNMDVAQRLYAQARAGTAEAVRRNPNDPKRLYDHAQNVFWIGEIARDRGRLSEAEAAYREYKRLADQMAAIEPDNLRWRMEVLYGEENIGIVLFYQRRYAEAARQFARALRPMEGLASVDSSNPEYQRELSTVLAWLADARSAEGRLDEAIALRQKQISFLERLMAGKASDVTVRQRLIPARQALGWLFLYRGMQARAIEQFGAAVRQAEELLPVEPENMDWLDLGAWAQFALAEALLESDRREEASRHVRTACDRSNRVLAKDNSSNSSRALSRRCLALRARVASESGAYAEARTLAARSLESARVARSGDPVRDRYGVAAAYRLLGDVQDRMGDDRAAKASWTSALSRLPSNIPERPWEMHERAEILKRLGRADEANAIGARLATIGYRRTF